MKLISTIVLYGKATFANFVQVIYLYREKKKPSFFEAVFVQV